MARIFCQYLDYTLSRGTVSFFAHVEKESCGGYLGALLLVVHGQLGEVLPDRQAGKFSKVIISKIIIK